MFKLKVKQKEYNQAYFYFNDIATATEFIKVCTCCDDDETEYILTYHPTEKEGE